MQQHIHLQPTEWRTNVLWPGKRTEREREREGGREEERDRGQGTGEVF